MSGKSPIATFDALVNQALTLPQDDRLELAERLLLSVAATQLGLHPSWETELACRVAELDAGVADLVSVEEVFAETRRILGSQGHDT